MAHSRASRHLAKATVGMRQSEIAAKTRCTQGFVSRLLAGVSKPNSRKLAVRIDDAFGTSPEWWDEPDPEAGAEAEAG